MVSGVTAFLRIVSPLPLFCYPSGTWSHGLCVISASSGLHFSAVDSDPRLKNGEKGQNGCPRGGGRDGMKKFRDEAGELRLTSGGLERRSIIKAAYTSYKFELAGLWTEN